MAPRRPTALSEQPGCSAITRPPTELPGPFPDAGALLSAADRMFKARVEVEAQVFMRAPAAQRSPAAENARRWTRAFHAAFKQTAAEVPIRAE